MAVRRRRRADVCTSLLYRWRRAFRAEADQMGFAPAVLIEGSEAVRERADGPAIMVELSGGVRVSVMGGARAALVAATLKALR